MKWSNNTSYEDTTSCIKHVPLVQLDLATVIKSCSDSKVLTPSLKTARTAYMKKQRELFGYTIFKESFFNEVGVTGDKEHFIGRIKFSYEEYITKLKHLLNADNLNEHSENFQRSLLDKVKELRQIKTIEDLKIKFPELYEKYSKGLEYYEEFTSQMDFLDKNDPNYEEQKRKIETKSRYYYQCGMRYILSKYIIMQASILECMINKVPDILEYIDANPLNNGYLVGIDHNKFELYVASEYLKQAKKYKTNHPNKIFYLKLLEEYFRHVEKKDISIVHDKTNEVISLAKLYDEFLELTSLHADWEFLPEEANKKNKEVPKEYDQAEINKEETDIPKEEVKENLEEPIDGELFTPELIQEMTGASAVGDAETLSFFEANKAKIMFYKDSGYIGTARGIKLNKGYTAFIYPNGVVVMDLIASKDNIKEAIGNGIYVVDAKDFYELSSMSKAKLRSLKERRKFIVHNEGWEERLQKILDKEVTEESQKESTELVRKLRSIKKR